MKAIARSSAVLSVGGLVLLVAALVAALLGMPQAPTYTSFMSILLVTTGALALLTVVSMREASRMRRCPMVWRAGAETSPEMSPDIRRRLVVHGFRQLAIPLSAAVVMMVVTLVMIAYPNARLWGRLRRDGIDTIGTVRAVRPYSSGSARLDYSFFTARGEVKGSSTISPTLAASIAPGKQINVCYLPNTPSESSPPSLPTSRADLTFGNLARKAASVAFLPVGFSLALFALGLAIAQVARRARSLLDHGVVAVGTVSRVRGASVHYSFEARTGLAEGKFQFTWAARPSPAPGDRFPLLYDPTHPSISAPWAVLKAHTYLGEGESSPSVGPDPGAFTLDRELMRLPPPGRRHAVRLTWQLPLTLVALVVVPLPQVLRLAESLDVQKRVARLQAEGVETTGHIRSLQRKTERLRDPLVISYEFTAEGKPHRGVFLVRSRRLEDRFGAAGSSTPVVYAPSDPGVSLPFPKSGLIVQQIAPSSEIAIPFLATIVGVIVVAGIFLARRALREWRMARDGRIVLANVLEVRSGLGRKIRYQFQSDHGVVEQSATVQSRFFATASGETIEVFFTSPPVESLPVRDLIFFKRVD
jgi:hypothetical protein